MDLGGANRVSIDGNLPLGRATCALIKLYSSATSCADVTPLAHWSLEDLTPIAAVHPRNSKFGLRRALRLRAGWSHCRETAQGLSRNFSARPATCSGRDRVEQPIEGRREGEVVRCAVRHISAGVFMVQCNRRAG